MSRRQIVVLFRHGKALKNEQNRHGGAGSPLSSSVDDTIPHFVALLKGNNLAIEEVICSPRLQCEQTAQRIAQNLGLSMKIDPHLEPIRLGVIDGLSDSEVETRFPELAKQMKAWRSGRSEIHAVNIPGMERQDCFFARGKEFVRNIELSGRSVLVVATRSILVLLASVMLNRHPKPSGNYREIPWPNDAYLTLEIVGKRRQTIPGLTTVLVP